MTATSTNTNPVTEARDEVAIAELDPRYQGLRLVEPEELKRLRASVDRVGQWHPVLVATAVESGKLVLVDGFKRVRIATDRGEPRVWVRRSALNATSAKVAMLAANGGQRGLSDLEEAWIVRSLCREQKLTQAEVGKALRRDKSWVCRRLKLAEDLEAALQEDIRLGLLSSTVARELARLPRGNQVSMAKSIQAHGLTSRQAHGVVTKLLRTSDPKAREEVLADPLRYLGKVGAAGRVADPRLSKPANELRDSLVAVAGVSAKCARVLTRCAPAGLAGDDARVLGPVVARTLHTAREAIAMIAQLAKDNGSP